MAALTRSRSTRAYAGSRPTSEGGNIAAATVIYQGALVGVDSAGNYIPASTSAVRIAGRSDRTYDNSTGLAGARKIEKAEYGTFSWVDADGNTAVTDIGSAVYAVDDQSVSKSSATSTRPFAGRIAALDPNGGIFVTTNPEIMYAEVAATR